MDNKSLPIGFFDSGVGGLSVLKEALKIMPNEDYIYFGDSINAPYGVKSINEIKELTFKGVDSLLNLGVKGVVVACNTATSAAVAALRVKYPELPLVGIEPALKPAVEVNSNGKIIIMATPMTLAQEKFNSLMNKYQAMGEISPMPCAGLMEFIENGILEGEELEEYLKEKFSSYNRDEIGAIVLGCTHYPFVRHTIQKIIGNNIPILDGGLGTSKEIKRRLKEKNLLNDRTKTGSVKIINSLNSKKIIELSYNLIK
ncbi:MAG: glutamate racemase [Clostridium sp.]